MITALASGRITGGEYGRPRKEDSMREHINFLITEEEKKAWKELFRSKGISLSKGIREVVREYMKMKLP